MQSDASSVARAGAYARLASVVCPRATPVDRRMESSVPLFAISSPAISGSSLASHRKEGKLQRAEKD